MGFKDLKLAKLQGDGVTWVGDGITRRPVSGQALSDLQYRITTAGGDATVETALRIDWLGQQQPAFDTDTIKQYVAQQVVAALTGVNGHIIPDGDVDRISQGVLDRMSLRLTQ